MAKNVKYQHYGTNNPHYKHGLRDTRLFSIWSNMKTRCYNKNVRSYKNYGGKGITICDEWLENFEKFYKWSMSNGYSDELSIDRINPNGNYEPTNCRWVNSKIQANNTSRNHMITHEGITLTVMEWSERLNVKYRTIMSRLNSGWSEEDALNKPVNCKFGRKVNA